MSGLESEEASEDEISAHDEDWTLDESILSGTGDREQRGEIANEPGKVPGKWVGFRWPPPSSELHPLNGNHLQRENLGP